MGKNAVFQIPVNYCHLFVNPATNTTRVRARAEWQSFIPVFRLKRLRPDSNLFEAVTLANDCPADPTCTLELWNKYGQCIQGNPFGSIAQLYDG